MMWWGVGIEVEGTLMGLLRVELSGSSCGRVEGSCSRSGLTKETAMEMPEQIQDVDRVNLLNTDKPHKSKRRKITE
ncbi:hypothetical protein ACLOJK_027906 [Asimina triloba]